MIYICRCCNQFLESKHRHDFKRFKNCKNESFIDGGDVYCRFGGIDLGLIRPQPKWTEEEQELYVQRTT